MKWDTAAKYCTEDGSVITHLYYGDRLRIPSINRDCRVRLVSHERDVLLGEVVVPPPALDHQAIETMMLQAGLPLTGWVPGYEHWSSRYNNPQFYLALLSMTRQLAAHSGQAGVSIAELRSKFAADQRLLMLHLFTLIEDQQGLVAVGTTHVRLATWRQAMAASAQLIHATAPRSAGETTLPEVQLRLGGDLLGRDCSITTTSSDPLAFRLMRYDKALISVTGNAEQIDQYLQQEGLPLGWAATHGENRSQMQHLWGQARAHQIG